jgi:hypothetical protein
LRDLCDVSYVILADRLIGDVRLQQAAALQVLAAGGTVESIPSVDDELAAFDEALRAPPPATRVRTPEDVEQAELREALGLPER